MTSHKFCSTKFSNRKESAFTLIEMLVTVLLLFVLAYTASSNVPELIQSFGRKNAKQEIDSDLRRARSEATKEGTRVVFEFINGGASYRVGFDYLPYSNPAVADKYIFQQNLSNDVTVSTSAPVIFDSRGYLIDASGDPTTVDIELRQDGAVFKTGTIFATGLLHYAS
ncbi:MAG: hypothetical protein GYA55_15205 [SAR324 cluster bacterium]|uniref:General secretion pathway GspH domain-containing protein n=1 Tax=SAR324 cluster bacterium TaxID=2024889 RepID=A0A7X9ILQ8_9DELT|nr:hypothetical protein [SAR324 cluster bacterium]